MQSFFIRGVCLYRIFQRKLSVLVSPKSWWTTKKKKKKTCFASILYSVTAKTSQGFVSCPWVSSIRSSKYWSPSGPTGDQSLYPTSDLTLPSRRLEQLKCNHLPHPLPRSHQLCKWHHIHLLIKPEFRIHPQFFYSYGPGPRPFSTELQRMTSQRGNKTMSLPCLNPSLTSHCLRVKSNLFSLVYEACMMWSDNFSRLFSITRSSLKCSNNTGVFQSLKILLFLPALSFWVFCSLCPQSSPHTSQTTANSQPLFSFQYQGLGLSWLS